MPRYEYQCLRCEEVTEALVGVTADSEEPAVCVCGGPLKRLMSAPAKPSIYSMGYGEDPAAMGPGEISMHMGQRRAIEDAARTDTLGEVRGGERTPDVFKPRFEKRLH